MGGQGDSPSLIDNPGTGGSPPVPAGDQHTARDRGSVAVLLLGMVFCLLFFAVGITAIGSANLGRRNLQARCDTAAAAVAGDVTPHNASTATGLARRYMQQYAPAVTVTTTIRAGTINLECSADSKITFGTVFLHPSLRITVTASAQPTLRLEQG